MNETDLQRCVNVIESVISDAPLSKAKRQEAEAALINIVNVANVTLAAQEERVAAENPRHESAEIGG